MKYPTKTIYLERTTPDGRIHKTKLSMNVHCHCEIVLAISSRANQMGFDIDFDYINETAVGKD